MITFSKFVSDNYCSFLNWRHQLSPEKKKEFINEYLEDLENNVLGVVIDPQNSNAQTTLTTDQGVSQQAVLPKTKERVHQSLTSEQARYKTLPLGSKVVESFKSFFRMASLLVGLGLSLFCLLVFPIPSLIVASAIMFAGILGFGLLCILNKIYK